MSGSGVGGETRGEPERGNARLWAAVQAITEPTKQRVDRGTEVGFLDDLASDDGQGGFCRIEDYRAAVLAYGAMPCLWLQAVWAVFGSEAGDGSGGRTSARERTPADLDLMETLLTIRESLGWQLPGRGVAWRKPGVIPDMMRQMANHVTRHEPQHVEWWAFRFEQWGRLLRAQLNAVDTGPRPVHLRGARCPLCRCATVFATEKDGEVTYEPAVEFQRGMERKVEPALRIDFTSGVIRAAQCRACGHAWFRGAELEALAEHLKESA